jgi:hypothetical protein
MAKFPARAILDTYFVGMCDADVAECLGLGIGTIRSWRARNSMLTANRADELAGRIRLGPWEIWPDWFTTGSSTNSRTGGTGSTGSPRKCGISSMSGV